MANNNCKISSTVADYGQPDKVCNIIADQILNELITLDNKTKADINVLIGRNLILLGGEILTEADIKYEEIVRNTLLTLGYTSEEMGLDPYKSNIEINIKKPSQDLLRALYSNNNCVNSSEQGTVYGYATKENVEMIPSSYLYAKKIAKEIYKVRRQKLIEGILPDGQYTVVFEYENGLPIRIDYIILSLHHNSNADLNWLRIEVEENIIKKVCEKYIDNNTKILINSGGRFTIGGTNCDIGCTGNNVEEETMGGVVRYAGLNFSGKDPIKINRSASMMCTKIAKDIIEQKMADKCEIGATYAVGLEAPVNINIECFGTESADLEMILDYIVQNYSFKIDDIVKELNLLAPIYSINI